MKLISTSRVMLILSIIDSRRDINPYIFTCPIVGIKNHDKYDHSDRTWLTESDVLIFKQMVKTGCWHLIYNEQDYKISIANNIIASAEANRARVSKERKYLLSIPQSKLGSSFYYPKNDFYFLGMHHGDPDSPNRIR